MNVICGPTSVPNSFKVLNAVYFKSVVINHFKGLVRILMYDLINYYSNIHIIVKHTFNALAIVYCTNVECMPLLSVIFLLYVRVIFLFFIKNLNMSIKCFEILYLGSRILSSSAIFQKPHLAKTQ